MISEETRKKLSESHKGYVMPEEQKRKIGAANKGKKLSKETKNKLSEANKGKIRSEEFKRKLRIFHTGRKHSEETKKKMSVIHTNPSVEINKIYQGDCLEVLKTFPDESVDMVMTSPPYWQQRDYNLGGGLGNESDPISYIKKLCEIFDEVKRVLKNNGNCFVVIDDTYGTESGNIKQGNIGTNKIQYTGSISHYKKMGVRAKSLCLIPERFVIEMYDRGWYVINIPIWYKRNAMPESMKDRFTNDYEFIFLFTKSGKHYFEQQFDEYTEPLNRWGGDNLIAKGKSEWDKGTGQGTYRDRDMRPNKQGRNKRCVWDITTKGYREAHFATYPEALCETPIKAGCPVGGIVLDPFSGAGTTALVAKKNGRNYIGIELSRDYCIMAEKRIHNECGLI